MNDDDRPLDARAFGAALTTTLAPVAVRAQQGFVANYRQATDGQHHVSRIAASSHTSHGGVRTALDRDGVVISNYQIRGTARIQQGDTTVVAAAGDFWQFRVDQPYSLTFEADFETVGIAVPLARTPRLWPGATVVSAVSTPGLAALGAIVDHLERELDHLPTVIRNRFIGHILDAFDTASHPLWADGTHEPEHGRLLTARALDVIDHELTDVILSPRFVAEALHVSVRALQTAFSATGSTVSSTIRARRLELARRELGDAELDWLSVSDIGARSGFAAPSHFAALFRETYGITPSEYRRRSRQQP